MSRISSSCPFLRLCSSHLLLSASTYFIVRVLSACCHLYPTPSRNYFVFYSSRTFFVSLISRVAFFLLCSRTRYASTWSAYLESLAFGFSLSHCLWPQNLNLSRMKNQEGHWGYCWCRWVEGTVECEDNDNKNNKNMINTLPWVPSVVRLSLGRRLVNLLPVAQRTNVLTPEIGSASWWHVDPYNIRSGPEYPAVQGGSVIRLGLGRRLVNLLPVAQPTINNAWTTTVYQV